MQVSKGDTQRDEEEHCGIIIVHGGGSRSLILWVTLTIKFTSPQTLSKIMNCLTL